MPADELVEVPASLRSRIQAYLAVRAAEDPAARAAALAAAADVSNPVAAYLGVTVVSAKRKAEVAQAGPLDPLNYLELNRLGFGDLVEPIFELGGYVAVSKSLAAQGLAGVAVSASPPPPPRREIELLGPPEVVGVAMGAALDDKLAEASRRAWVDKNNPSRDAAETALWLDDNDAPAVQRRGRRLLAAADAASDIRGMPEAPLRYDRVVTQEAKAAKQAALVADAAAAKRGPQPLELGLAQRGYAVAAAAVVAVAWGHASDEALLKQLLDPQVREVCQAASVGVGLGNLAACVLSVRLSVERGRKVPLWLLKAALAGPLALNELRALGPVDDPQGRERAAPADNATPAP